MATCPPTPGCVPAFLPSYSFPTFPTTFDVLPGVEENDNMLLLNWGLFPTSDSINHSSSSTELIRAPPKINHTTRGEATNHDDEALTFYWHFWH